MSHQGPSDLLNCLLFLKKKNILRESKSLVKLLYVSCGPEMWNIILLGLILILKNQVGSNLFLFNAAF